MSVDQKAQKDEACEDHLFNGKNLFGPLAKNPQKRGIDQNDDERGAIDSRDIRYLDKRKGEILRVTQVRPRKTCQKERAEVFQGHPEERGEKHRLKS